MEIEKVSGDYRPLILVAEDDDSNFKLIKAIIGKKCEILWAKNGEDIVNLFEENRDKAEAILMDIKMPIMNGLDATVIIRKKDKELPIIMQTAYAFTADRCEGVLVFEAVTGYLAIALGALAWWFGITFFVNKVRTQFNLRGIWMLNRIIGSIVIVVSVLGLVFTLMGESLY